jgi:hypothetical protein
MMQPNYAGVPQRINSLFISSEVRPINMCRMIIAKVKSAAD